METRAFVFDAYGTLFDVHSAVARHASQVGENAARVSEIWRNKQLEYSWVRSGMSRYRDFWSLTCEALDFALATVPGANRNARENLLNAYRTLDCYAEVPQVLGDLRKRGARLAILSNGSPDMLESAVQSAGLSDLFDNVFSVDEVGVFKTDRRTYAMVTQAYGIGAEAVSFQSSNRWDVAGAAAFGFQCRWINRTGQADEYSDLPPVETLGDLGGLVRLFPR
ncbi:MAG: haloacid dehalogenase type II [Rhizobiaceae bacterium]